MSISGEPEIDAPRNDDHLRLGGRGSSVLRTVIMSWAA
jgi:hypothetical protein